jgi:ABC-type hemin transport system ATPase subunit
MQTPTNHLENKIKQTGTRMKTSIKRSLEPQATRLTFALLAIVMISFGVMAEQHTQSPHSAQHALMSIQIITNTTSTQPGQ